MIKIARSFSLELFFDTIQRRTRFRRGCCQDSIIDECTNFSCSAQIRKGAKGGEPVAKGMRDDVDVEDLRGRKAERENKIRG